MRQPRMSLGGMAVAAVALTAFAVLMTPVTTVPLADEGAPRDSTIVFRGERGPSATEARRFGESPRRVWARSLVTGGWQTVPMSLATVPGLVLLGNADGTIAALDAANGSSVWVAAPEMLRTQPYRLVPLRGGRAAVLGDARDSILIVATASGRPVAHWAAPVAARSGCGEWNGGALLASIDTGEAILQLDSAGVMRGRLVAPWVWGGRAHPLQAQTLLAGDALGTCVAALAVGPGFSVYLAGRLAHAIQYVESVTTPDVTVRVQWNGQWQRTAEARLDSREVAANDVAVMDGVAYIAFGGRSAVGGRVVDRYDVRTGRYLGSMVFQAEVQRLAAGDGCLFVGSYEAGVPTLTCFATPRAR